MTEGEVFARDPRVSSISCRVAGQNAISHLLRVHDRSPRTSRLSRIFGIGPLSRQGRSAYRTAVGEVEVGEQLDSLGDEWHVFHSVPVGAEAPDIDHVAIGPGGVHIVTTAVHAGAVVEASQRTFTSSGMRFQHIRDMEHEMGRVERLLSAAAGAPVQVSGVLAVVGPKSLTVREDHRDVAILPAATIARWLAERPRVVDPAEVSAIAAAAALPQTWHSDDAEPEDPRMLKHRFDALHSDVLRAVNVQKIWATLLTVAGAATFILLAYAMLNDLFEAGAL